LLQHSTPFSQLLQQFGYLNCNKLSQLRTTHLAGMTNRSGALPISGTTHIG
jgi:hypothetical protein